MILSNRFVRTYLFGSKVAEIHNKSFECCVSTAKEGWFQKLSTIISEPKIDSTVGAAAAGLRPCGKVIYSSTLRKSERFEFHDVLAKTLDAAGEEGCTLEEALEQIFTEWKRRGIAAETVNLAADPGQADAQVNLGGLYVNGEGVPQDAMQMPALCRTWLSRVRRRKGSLGICTTKAKACPRTTRKRHSGGARPLSKATPRRNTASGDCTTRAGACPRTTHRQRFGIARRLNKVTLMRNTSSGVCTTTAKACPRTTRKRQHGIARRLSRVSLLRNPTSGFVRQGPRRAPRLRSSCVLVSQGR